MEKRNLGCLPVSVVGLGCNNFGMTIDADATQAVVDAAIDAGINYFDTADLYGRGKSEEFLGAALGRRRDQVVVATKFGHPGAVPEGRRGGDPAWIRKAVDASLLRLNTDRIDHYQLHMPDPETPQAETLGALAELVEQGKVLEIGCSNFSADQIDEATGTAAETGAGKYASVQNYYSVLTRSVEEDGVVEACERNSMAVVPYFPLESGLLTGKYSGLTPPEGTRLSMWKGEMRDMFLSEGKLAAVERLTAYAADQDRSILELAIGWLVSNPAVATVICGATKPSQVNSNVAAANWAMSPDERSEIAALAS
ncbi:aldo/keto reductase [Candidatus Poriferisocius sp.]|uniref:aldo/keto reductase n=1 Tax=Candidatus Poriferisocius sp. TaxID=3101276 RepID=UPI003B022CC7